MLIYKFGGASIASPERAAALLPIIQQAETPLVIVISALGKTTNALEKIVHTATKGDKKDALQLVENLTSEHTTYAAALLNDVAYLGAIHKLEPLYAELKKAVVEADEQFFDRSYDSIVSLGELFSTTIVSCYLRQQQFSHEWVDARSIIRTDDTYRDAAIDWTVTKNQAQERLASITCTGSSIITQGFIGATPEGRPTTLGREGSDYTAAVLASLLGAQSVTIWKDVPGLLNADPKMFPDTVNIPAISFSEVIEMSFYGAQIIHPKTIKPLQNAGIPLYVRCFLDASLKGSEIRSDATGPYPPLIVRKDDQLLLQVTTRDFSFITEDNLSFLYATFHQLKIKINLMQNAAISFTACIDNNAAKVTALIHALNVSYQIRVNQGVSLLTIRHYTPSIFETYAHGREVLLKQETRKTIQAVLQ